MEQLRLPVRLVQNERLYL